MNFYDYVILYKRKLLYMFIVVNKIIEFQQKKIIFFSKLQVSKGFKYYQFLLNIMKSRQVSINSNFKGYKNNYIFLVYVQYIFYSDFNNNNYY